MRVLFFLACILCFQRHYSQQVLSFDNQRDLIPEGISVYPPTGTIYISSIAQKKIIKIAAGKAEDFIVTGQDGFLEGLGLKVDAAREWLWALSNSRNGNIFTSKIHAFDLISGQTVHQYEITDTVPRLFNDLVLDSAGMLYITDTYFSSINKYDPSMKRMQLHIRDTSRLQWPNGITFLNDTSIAVATYGKGIVRVDLPSKKINPMRGFSDSTLAFGLDGLVSTTKDLYGIYNAGKAGYASNAVVKYTLDESRRKIISETVLDRGNPSFADPTTAVIFQNKLYVIANSHLDQFNANMETVEGIENALTPLKLVVYELK